jgi:hypothetical protein
MKIENPRVPGSIPGPATTFNFEYSLFFMPTSSLKINQRIEAVCEAGCDAVRASIQTLEAGHQVALTDDLSSEECRQVLAELKTLMSVYDRH